MEERETERERERDNVIELIEINELDGRRWDNVWVCTALSHLLLFDVGIAFFKKVLPMERKGKENLRA